MIPRMLVTSLARAAARVDIISLVRASARFDISVRAALLVGLALPACSPPAKGADKLPVPVKVRVVEQREGGAPTRYSGSLDPSAKVDMAFRVGGYVEAIGQVEARANAREQNDVEARANARERSDTSEARGKRALDKGDFVSKGSVLARVRSADYVQKLATAKAQLAQARAESKVADEELERAQKLFAAAAITQAELDAKSAKAEAAKAQVEGALAHVNEAAISLDDTVLRAPMDGVILARHVEIGTLVAPGQAAFSIADTRTVKAVFGAPQSLVERLELGSALSVFVGAEGERKAPEKLLQARVTRIAPAADTNGRVFSIEAELPNHDGTLRPGAVVSVHVPARAQDHQALVVPLRAIVRSPRNSRGFSVFVLDGDGHRAVAHLRDVQLGEVVGNAVTVTDGLALHQRVVTVGSTLLRDGSDAVVIR